MNKTYKAISISDIYLMAKGHTSFDEFEQKIKSTLTGLPITQVIDVDIEIRLVEDQHQGYENNIKFWERLSESCSDVEVNDPMSEEELDMIKNVCKNKLS